MKKILSIILVLTLVFLGFNLNTVYGLIAFENADDNGGGGGPAVGIIEYNDTDGLQGYLDSNVATYSNGSNVSFYEEDYVWTGHDFAVWTNSAYTDLLDTFGGKTKYIDSRACSYCNYSDIPESTLEFQYDYLPDQVYSAREYYFFSTVGVNSQLEALTLARAELVKLEGEKIMEVTVQQYISAGVIVISVVGSGGTVAVIPMVMSVYDGITLLLDIMGVGQEVDTVREEISEAIGALTAMRGFMDSGREVGLLQIDYELEKEHVRACGINNCGETDTYTVVHHYRSKEASYLPGTSEVNYEYIYFQVNQPVNRLIYVNQDDSLLPDYWARRFPSSSIGSTVNESLVFAKEIYQIEGDSFTTNDMEVEARLSYGDNFDWYKVQAQGIDDVRMSLRNISTNQYQTLQFEIYDMYFNLLEVSNSRVYYEDNVYKPEEYINTTLSEDDIPQTYYIRVKVYADSIESTYDETYEFTFDFVRKTYVKQVESYGWVSQGYSNVYNDNYYLSGTTYSSDGQYKYVTTPSSMEYKYNYYKYEWYDRMAFTVKVQGPTIYGCAYCDTDYVADTFSLYTDYAPSNPTSLRYYTIYTTSSIHSSYTYTFPNSTDGFYYNGMYIHFSESDAAVGEYFLDDYYIIRNDVKDYLGYYTTSWGSSRTTGTSGDLYYSYVNEQLRYKSKKYEYLKTYLDVWVDTSTTITIGVHDPLPSLAPHERWGER